MEKREIAASYLNLDENDNVSEEEMFYCYINENCVFFCDLKVLHKRKRKKSVAHYIGSLIFHKMM